MKERLDMSKIAKTLGAVRRGKVSATAGYFGAAQLVADIEARFRIPVRGGRPTDPSWTEKRLVGLSTDTLHQLQTFASRIRKAKHMHVEPMQLAALLLERATRQTTDKDLEELSIEKHTPKGLRRLSSGGSSARKGGFSHR